MHKWQRVLVYGDQVCNVTGKSLAFHVCYVIETYLGEKIYISEESLKDG
jgi:hypothetical protein